MGSEQGGESGEGRGENQENPQNKAGELSEPQPSHTVVSQKTIVLNKDKSTSLAASSQKDIVIEKGPRPGARAKRVRDTDLVSAPSQFILMWLL